MAYGSVLGRNTKPQFVPTFAISGPFPGDTVTVSHGGTTVEAVEDNGVWYAKAWAYGSYTVSVGSKSTTVNVDEVKLYEVTLITVDTDLKYNSWDIVRKVSDMGQASNYWKIGDAKLITLNSDSIGHLQIANWQVWLFIIGFDHNANLEGSNRIHFHFAKNVGSNRVNICLTDRVYNSSPVTTDGYFSMNGSRTNSGGWASSQMRANICGTSLSNYSGTIIEAIPADFRAVLKPVTKYTDNIANGSGSTASNITATTDYLFLLSEYEIFGSIVYGNTAEKNKQAQYAYYSAGNSKIFYKLGDPDNKSLWALRSPCAGNSFAFTRVNTDGTVAYDYADISLGVAPGFCV